jgi:hypothetical protein
MTATMHAIRQQAFGGPEVLELTEVERPVPRSSAGRGAVVSDPRMEFLAPHDEPVIVFRRTFNVRVTGRSAFPTFQARELYLSGEAKRGLAESHNRLDELLGMLAS